MEVVIIILVILILLVLGIVFMHVQKLGPSMISNRERDLAALESTLHKSLGDQRADFRDVSMNHFQSLQQSVQDALAKQSLVMEQRFETLQRQNDQRLQEIRASVEKRLQENLEQNFGAFKEMTKSLGQLKSSADQMLKISEQVSELNQILASPKLQGNFGEAALQQLLADILPKGGYEWQPRLAEGCQPDATIRVKDLRLCIDAKFPKDRISALLDEALDEAAREQARKELGKVIREMASDISKKYIRPDLRTTDQAFLFVPSEKLYYEILRMPELTEHCRKVKVTIVSPNTLAATLYAVALAFRGYEMQENARVLLSTIQDMDRHFDGFRKDFVKVGQRLAQAQEDFTKANRDLERFDKTIMKLRDGQAQLGLEEQEK